MKTCLANYEYVNPIAFDVFPLLYQAELTNENYTERVNIVKQLDIICKGIRNIYSNINSIDFRKYAGDTITIDVITHIGESNVGRFYIPEPLHNYILTENDNYVLTENSNKIMIEEDE